MIYRSYTHPACTNEPRRRPCNENQPTAHQTPKLDFCTQNTSVQRSIQKKRTVRRIVSYTHRTKEISSGKTIDGLPPRSGPRTRHTRVPLPTPILLPTLVPISEAIAEIIAAKEIRDEDGLFNEMGLSVVGEDVAGFSGALFGWCGAFGHLPDVFDDLAEFLVVGGYLGFEKGDGGVGL
jgi:hypothetical protein